MKAGFSAAFKKAAAWTLSLFFAFTLTACAPAATEGTVRFTDALGRSVSLPAAPVRVAALYGSFAETWALAGGTLCGVTDDVVEEERLEVDGIPLVGSVKHPDWERVIGLEPDLVLLSADIASHRAGDAMLTDAGVPHAYFKVEAFGDYLSLLRLFTGFTVRDDLYRKNGEAIGVAVEASIERAKEMPPLKILFLRAFSTGIKAKSDDNVVSHILRDFGCIDIAEGHAPLLGDATAELSQEIVLQADPDVILSTAMGDQAAADRTFEALLKTGVYRDLTAVVSGRTYMLPKKLFHYKPNARWGEAYAYLEKILYQ